MGWVLVASVLARPFLYVILYLCFVYWIAKGFWKIIPPGRLKNFLFRRRGHHR